jgi:PAS domain S-box-containing protein
MDKTIKKSEFLSNKPELSISKLSKWFSDMDPSMISGVKFDSAQQIFRDIVGILEKVEEHDYKYQKSINGILSAIKKSDPSLTLSQQIAPVIALRNLIEKKDRTDQTNDILNLLDRSVLALCKKYETDNMRTASHNKKVIDNLKIVKNDLQKELNSSWEIMKKAPFGLAGCDSDLQVKLWNSTASNLTGYHSSDIIGTNVLNIFTSSSQEIILNQLSPDNQRIKKIKLNIQTQDGGIFNAFVMFNRLRTEIKSGVLNIFTFIDLSKEDLIKTQLEKIEQLSAIARLSDAIMHDIRNPINALALNIDVLVEKLDHISPDHSGINTITNKINRQIDNLADNLQRYIGYAKMTELLLEPIDLSILLDEIILDLRYQVSGRKIEVKYNRPKSLNKILADKIQLNRVFRNLLENSIDAIADNGTIQINIRKKRQYLNICIEDNGCGIAPDNLDNIFKPYFSNKERGTGLGLFIVREIVNAHDGKITCNSIIDQGSRFNVDLPLLTD